MIRVMLVDDQSIVRQGLKALLELAEDIEVVADADNGRTALEQLALLESTAARPDVVLMDIRMPQMDGVAATRQLSGLYPDMAVLVLTTFDNDEYISQALHCGAMGYLLKDTPAKELAEAIRLVHKGYNQLGPGILQKVLAHMATATEPIAPPLTPPPGLSALTPREQEVLRHIARGASNQEIARTLYITEGTVKFHVTNILSQLQLRDRTQAAILANSYPDWLSPN